MTAPTRHAAPASPVVRSVTVVAVVLVALIAAVVSYSHMQQLAERAGEAWRSWLIPLSIDGLVVAASMVLVTRRRAGLPASRLAWAALGAGAAASLAANMADARPEVTSVLVAGWAPVAFAVAFELLLQQRRADRDHTRSDAVPRCGAALSDTEAGERPAWAPTPTPTVVPSSMTPAVVSLPGSPPSSGTGSSPAVGLSLSTAASAARTADGTPTQPGDDQLVARVRALLADSVGQPPGRRSVAKHLNISEHRARVALDLIGATEGPARNGTTSNPKPETSSRGAR